MKLTTKGRYAVMAMADLATNGDVKPVSLTEIATRQNISLSYLEQLFLKLKSKNLVKSVRGSNGGYTLDKPASQIKLSNIIFAVDETVKTLNLNTDDIIIIFWQTEIVLKIFSPQTPFLDLFCQPIASYGLFFQ